MKIKGGVESARKPPSESTNILHPFKKLTDTTASVTHHRNGYYGGCSLSVTKRSRAKLTGSGQTPGGCGDPGWIVASLRARAYTLWRYLDLTTPSLFVTTLLSQETAFTLSASKLNLILLFLKINRGLDSYKVSELSQDPPQTELILKLFASLGFAT